MPNRATPEQGLASTARWIAAVRAAESRREDRLLHDPWAAALAGPEGEAWLAGRAKSPVLALMLVRARYFDDFLVHAAEHALRQIVLLGAGLDTRAYRLSWPPGTHVFELDQAEVLDAKEAVLEAAGAAPTCARHALPADLSRPWADGLVGAGFDPVRPSCWLLEGFLFYLPNEAIARVLDEVSRLAAPGSRLGFDIVNARTLTHPMTRPWVEMQAQQGAPWLGTMDDPAAFLSERGWRATLAQPGEEGAAFGRWPFPVLPRALPDVPRSWFVTALKDA